MHVLAINGSPRKTWNTATLLKDALEGAASLGAEAELVHLYDLSYKGCRSCFACKARNGKSYGRCAIKDDLAPVLEKASKADVLLLGSPIFFRSVTGELRSFMERLMFPYAAYTEPYSSLSPKKSRVGFIYTMNNSEEEMKANGFDRHLAVNESMAKLLFGSAETLFSFDTYQFEDYSKVIADRFDEKKKAARRKDVFPQDRRKAFELGARLAKA